MQAGGRRFEPDHLHGPSLCRPGAGRGLAGGLAGRGEAAARRGGAGLSPVAGSGRPGVWLMAHRKEASCVTVAAAAAAGRRRGGVCRAGAGRAGEAGPGRMPHEVSSGETRLPRRNGVLPPRPAKRELGRARARGAGAAAGPGWCLPLGGAEAKEGHLVDALALRGDEGRGTLRKARGRCERSLIPGSPNGATHPAMGTVTSIHRVAGRTRRTETSQ